MGVVGPGAAQEQDLNIQPLLSGASEYEYITILNPLTDDFAIRVAQDIPVNMPFNIGRDMSGKTSQTTLNERDAAQTYGLSLKNPDFQARKHITNDVVIKSGQTLNLKGNEAQVAVKQIVNELMQREGNSRLMSDPTLRREAEERVIISRGSIQDLMDNRLQSPQDQLNQAIKQSNEVPHGEEAEFPGLSQPESPVTEAPAGITSPGTETVPPEELATGRPEKV